MDEKNIGNHATVSLRMSDSDSELILIRMQF